MDIVDALQEQFDDPDIITMLTQAIEETFHRIYPMSNISITSTNDPDVVHVLVDPPYVTYDMVMTDDWEDQDNLSFTFTSTLHPNDQVIIDLAQT